MRGRLLIIMCGNVPLTLAGPALLLAQDSPELTVTTPRPAGAFQIRLARAARAEGFAAAQWHVSSGMPVDFPMFVGPDTIVSGTDVRSVTVTECPADHPGKAFGLWVAFRREAWGPLRELSTHHMGELVAILVNGKIVDVARIRGMFDARIEVCPHADTAADAGNLAREIAGAAR